MGPPETAPRGGAAAVYHAERDQGGDPGPSAGRDAPVSKAMVAVPNFTLLISDVPMLTTRNPRDPFKLAMTRATHGR